jgi:DNA repair protein RecO (recombination protein O)
MKTIVTKGVVLTRTDYGEADRILHFLTPDHGKISSIAKGVRKSKSKLAGGIELFSVSELSFIVGKSEIYTIISARLDKHFDNIVKDLDRTNAGYDFIRLINKATEDNPEPAYFKLIADGFEALDDINLSPKITSLWFKMHLIKLAGHSPNLKTDCNGDKLSEREHYKFDFDKMCFDLSKAGQGVFSANHIKFMRLGFAASNPQILQKVQEAHKLEPQLEPLVLTTLQTFVRI